MDHQYDSSWHQTGCLLCHQQRLEPKRSHGRWFSFSVAELAVAAATYLEQIPPRVPEDPFYALFVMLGVFPPVCSKFFSTVTLTCAHCLAACTAPCPFSNAHVTWTMTDALTSLPLLQKLQCILGCKARVGMLKVAIRVNTWLTLKTWLHGSYCGGPWIWGWQNCTSRAQKLEPHLLVKVHSASAPWLNHCRSQCNIRLAAEIDIVIFEWQQKAWESRGWAIATLKLELGKQRLSNSCLKTGAGKADVEQ